MTPRAALNALLSSEDFHALEARLRRVSAFHILGIETREISHAALLAWLLDPHASHGMGSEPLRRFVLLAARMDATGSMLDAVDIDQLDLADALTQTEQWIDVPGTDRRRRLDILVSAALPGEADAKPVLVIEYKVDATEGEDQTADYARWAATQPLRFGEREVLPLQVYLCPVASDDRAPASPFVTIGYDAYLGWADGVSGLEKTAQAAVLLDEWRACLQVRNDVVDDEQEALTAKLEEDHGEALAFLRGAGRPELAAYQHVVDQHAEVLTQLGVRIGRRGGLSKGYSGTIALTREVLQGSLDEELWSVSGGGGSVRAVLLPFVRQVAAWANSKERLSGLRMQLFADRPKNGRFHVVLEVVGDLAGADREASLAMRLRCGDALRAALEAVDAGLPFRSRATAFRFDVDVPAIDEVEADTDEAAATYRAALEQVSARVARVEAALVEWCGSALPKLLEDAQGPT
ncbi:MAG: PD-(D/E)XK nuclease family protein [Myxococcales bacterium]|nr:PD-(D/E)XK nuclease family protein [Myxococcales bacterium]